MELCMEIYPNFEWFRRDYLEISNDDWLATFWMMMWLFGPPNTLSWTWDTLEIPGVGPEPRAKPP